MGTCVYDEEASREARMDVVLEVDEGPFPVSRWVEAMRRLTAVRDPLARRLVELHVDCGSGDGVCDSGDDDGTPVTARWTWGCETTAIIAEHCGVDYPAAPAAPSA